MVNKSKKNILLWLIFIILLGILSFIFYNKTLDNNNSQSSFLILDNKDPDIQNLNIALQEAKSLSDVKKCEVIKNKDVKQNCISQITFKFDDINKAKNEKDCLLLWDKDWKTSIERQDICFLNLNYNFASSSDAIEKWCKKIQNEDIQSLCIAQNKLKFK